MEKKSFVCKNCGRKVNLAAVGTRNRNHCPYCLWSLHVDERKSGDRRSNCRGLMEPVGLTFKDEGVDKYGKKRQGEIMLVFKCLMCGKVLNNRISGDDNPQAVLAIGGEKDKEEIKRQLFGK